MDLTTRCPRCDTVFQVGLQDLQLRKGYIRCVQCAHIFDGYAEVVSEPSDPTREPRLPPEHIELKPVEPPFVAPDRVDPPLIAPRVFRSNREGAEPRFTVGGLGGEPQADAPREDRGQRTAPGRIPPIIVEPHPVRASHHGGSAAPLLRADHGGLLERLGRWTVAALVLLGVLLLVAQLAYVYRTQIALTFPGLRPVLERACAPLDCRIPYARNLGQLAITGSALKLDISADETKPGVVPRHFILVVSLRNQANLPQEWPSIVLDLNDASGARLVRRNLQPSEYLTPEQLAGPFAADSELRVQLPITLNEIQINGYQLDLFFP